MSGGLGDGGGGEGKTGSGEFGSGSRPDWSCNNSISAVLGMSRVCDRHTMQSNSESIWQAHTFAFATASPEPELKMHA